MQSGWIRTFLNKLVMNVGNKRNNLKGEGNMAKKYDVHGYYLDGKKLWILYKNKYGKIVRKEMKDE